MNDRLAGVVLALEGARAVIGDQFPSVDASSLRHVGSGWEFDAFLTADGWLFRFPRDADAAKLFEPERRVHELMSRYLPAHVALPKAKLSGRPGGGFPYPFAGHRFIRGVPADAVREERMPVLAQEIAAALGAIHGVSLEEARAAGIGALDVGEEGRLEWVEHGLRVANELRGLGGSIDRAVEWATAAASSGHRSDHVGVIHNDLSPEHVIVDPATGCLTGILDWTDAILGDPARDFVFLVTWRGWDFAEEVLRLYPGRVDAGFRERLCFMARLLSVLWLGHAHERGADITEHVEGVRNSFARDPTDEIADRG